MVQSLYLMTYRYILISSVVEPFVIPIPSSPNALLAHPFRPFFLLVGVYGVLIVLAWMAFLFGGLPLPLGWSPLHWHSHEMIYGLVPAAIAGFLLTAMTNWTGDRKSVV